MSVEKLFDFLKFSHKELLEHLSVIQIKGNSPSNIVKICLYSRLIELTHSQIILWERKSYAGIDPIFRTFFEAYVDLENLFNDQNYIQHIHYEYHRQWLVVLHAAQSSQNPFLSKIGRSPDLQQRISYYKEQLAILKKAGIEKCLTKKEKLCRTNMKTEYESIYNFLCSDSHNDYRSLISHHIEEDGDNFNVVLFRKELLEDSLPILDAVAALLLNVSERIHLEYKSSKVADIQKLKAEFAKIRSEYATLS